MAGATLSRRLFLNVGTLALAGLALPGCERRGAIEIALSSDPVFEYFEPDHANILRDVANIMIPRTDTAGALDTNTILYLDQLMMTWAGSATKSEILDFIARLDQHADDTHQSRYLDLPEALRIDLIREIDRDSFSAPPDSTPIALAPSYRRIKALIFHIHYSSEAANPDFVLIPGQYKGDISEAEYLTLVEDNRY